MKFDIWRNIPIPPKGNGHKQDPWVTAYNERIARLGLKPELVVQKSTDENELRTKK